MIDCTVIYAGNNQIATNFYSKTEVQKAKRSILGVNKQYDILSTEYIKVINDGCKNICVVGLNKRITGHTFLFNSLIEMGVDIRKITTFHGDQSIGIASKITDVQEDKYKSIFERELILNKEERVISELTIMAMESLHNLYWKTGRTNKWEEIHTRDKEAFRICENKLKEKYSTDNLSRLFFKKTDKIHAFEFEEADKIEYNKLKAFANRGFNAIIRAAATIKENGPGVFLYFYNNYNKDYWKLDSSEYYTLMIHGMGYPLRYVGKRDLNFILKRGEVESLADFRVYENRLKLMQNMNNALRWYKEKEIDITSATNKMVLSLIKPLYNISEDVHLYTCDNGCVGLIIKKNVSLLNMLRMLNKLINILGVSNCFDSICVEGGIGQEGRTRFHDITNPMRLDLKYLKKIEELNGDVNGCDKQQVLELFNILRE